MSTGQTSRVVLNAGSLLAVRLPKSPDDPDTPQEDLREDYALYAAIYEETAEWCGGTVSEAVNERGEYYHYIYIPNIEGSIIVRDLDWILRNGDGTFTAMSDADYWRTEGGRTIGGV